ncbi:MAG: chorismate mutase [Clostridia bacterium]|nr:chorismate mutase [Clostridia bacterium]
MSNRLDEARQIINEVDKKMAELFVKRMRAAEIIAEYKREHGLEVLDEQREAEVIRRNSSLVENDELRAYYVNYLKNTMAVSRSYQSKLLEGMRVAYCGTEGAFAHIVACKLFPTAIKVAYESFEAAYAAAVDGECDVALLPMENSYQGEVGQVTDLMFSGSLYINSIAELPVSHDLLVVNGASAKDIKTVVSHPQALGQCNDYIKAHGYEVIEYSNTALAAKYVAERGDVTVAAIASEEAGKIYGLKLLDKNINSARNNTTRFAVFSRSMNTHSSKEMGIHTVLLFTVRNEAGALAKAIDIIGKHGFNMRALRSRPMKELLWEYYFYVEAEGNINTSEGQTMLVELAQYCDRLKAVGTFTKAN